MYANFCDVYSPNAEKNNRFVLKDKKQEFILKTPKEYEIDFDKIKSFEELAMLVRILFKELKISVREDSIYWDELKNYLKED